MRCVLLCLDTDHADEGRPSPTSCSPRRRRPARAASALPQWLVLPGALTRTAPGKVVTRRFMDEDIVLYRTRYGRPRAVHPYCPHLGAHFGAAWAPSRARMSYAPSITSSSAPMAPVSPRPTARPHAPACNTTTPPLGPTVLPGTVRERGGRPTGARPRRTWGGGRGPRDLDLNSPRPGTAHEQPGRPHPRGTGARPVARPGGNERVRYRRVQRVATLLATGTDSREGHR